ncbi:MAG: hypothetical protein MJZ98_04705 [Paludibacteraceae bacterium]|nr:hypothetical protein [Paludibacteraceae bacterium]
MKKLFTLAIALCSVLMVSAQGSVKETTTEMNKQNVRAFELTLVDKNVDLVTAAVRERLEKTEGLKLSKIKGFNAYQGVTIPSISSTVISVYTNVESLGKKSAGSKITMVVCSDNGTPITQQTHPDLYESTMKYMEGFVDYVFNYDVNQQIAALTTEIAKLQKESDGLTNDKAKLEKNVNSLVESIASMEEKLNKAKTDLQNTQNALANKEDNLKKKNGELEDAQNKMEKLKNSLR